MPIDSVYRHYEDDGRLSMFTSGGEILITCSEGHLRRLGADETGMGVPTPRPIRRQIGRGEGHR